MRKDAYFLSLLLRSCEHRFGATPSTSYNFEQLAQHIDTHIHQTLGVSTLKRLWGYVDNPNKVRTATLDILALYCGFDSFERFCSHHTQTKDLSSDFFSIKHVQVNTLSTGQRIEVGWAPNRFLVLQRDQDGLCTVIEARNSKILVGDRVDASLFALGQPLFFGMVVRNGVRMPMFMAAKEHGITLLSIQ